MPRTTLDLTDDQYDELQKLAADLGIKQADVLRSALRLFGRVRVAMRGWDKTTGLAAVNSGGVMRESISLEGIRLL